MIPTGTHPIQLLLDIERRAKEFAQGLPQQLEVKSTWDGIGFRMGPLQAVAQMEHIHEILTFPRITRVPGARSWVRGLANVRGNLLPVLDLKGFLTNDLGGLQRSSRVLVIRHRGIAAGLLVDEVFGMRHFLEEEFSEGIPPALERFRPFLRGGFRQEGEHWMIFGIHELVESPGFMQVAS